MKKLFLFAAVICAAVFSSCSDEYDDTALRNEMDGLKDRVTALEQKLTSEVNALKAMINALESGLAVSVEEITGGYEITIGDKSFSIYNGKDGQDGTDGKDGIDGTDGKDGKDGTVISIVKVGNDYYWAIDGVATEYKVTGNDGADGSDGEDGSDGSDGSDGADGEDGSDGYTPYIKDGMWYINGEEVGPATGADGKDGDSFFKSVVVDEENGTVTITLNDEASTSFTLNLAKEAKYTDLKSIKFVPEYSDGKTTISYAEGASDAFIVAKFEVVPATAAEVIAANVNDASMQAVYTKTRAEAGEIIDMPISSIEAADGIVTVTASGENLASEFFDGTLGVSVRFAVQDDLSGNASGYIPAVAKKEVLLKAEAYGYQGMKLSWNALDDAETYKVSYGEFISEALTATEYVIAENTLTDANTYEVTVTAYNAKGEAVSKSTKVAEVYTLCNWTEPEFELQIQADGTYKFIAHKLANLNYAYAGMTADGGKSTIEIYKDAELLYTLVNSTPAGTLAAWAGYGRWALGAQDDRYEWTWTGVNNSGNEVKTVPASWFAPGEYTIKYKIGYVVNKNGRWAKSNNESDVVANREDGATVVFFGPKDKKPSPNVLYTDASKNTVAVFTKEGYASKSIVVTQPIVATAVAKGYQGAKVTWTNNLDNVVTWKVSAGDYTSDAIDGALTEFVVPENSLTKNNKYAFTVTAYDAEGKILASNTTGEIQIWTLANRPEPVVTLVDGVLTMANAEINEGATKKDNLHIYGAVLEAEIYFYRNNDKEPSHVAKGTYLDSYPGVNLPLSYTEKKLKNNIAGAYTSWKWDGAETATKTMPSFEGGTWTVKYKAGYHTYVNASYGPDRLLFSDSSDALQTIVYREGTSDLTFEVEGTSLSATAVADGYQSARVSWQAKNVSTTGYEVYAGGKKVAEAAADATSVMVTGLTDAQKYTFEVKAVGTDLTAATDEIEIYTLCNWTEPVFELQTQDDGTYKFIAHNLINLNYAYGGMADTDSGKSTIEIYKDGNLVYTLTNTTGQGTLTAWAGYKRWQISAMNDRYEWTWTGVNNSGSEVKTVPAEWFTPGEYTIKYKIGYVVNKNGQWATKPGNAFIPQAEREGATFVYFAGGMHDVYGVGGNVAVITKEGTASFTIEAPAAAPTVDLVGTYTKAYHAVNVDAKDGANWTSGTYGGNPEPFTKVTASTEDGPKWITTYTKYGLTLYFDVDTTSEVAGKPGCYAVTNLIDRGPSNKYPDKIVDHGSYYNSTTGEIVFNFVIEASSAPGGYNGGTLEANGVTVPGWAIGVTMTPSM